MFSQHLIMRLQFLRYHFSLERIVTSCSLWLMESSQEKSVLHIRVSHCCFGEEEKRARTVFPFPALFFQLCVAASADVHADLEC